MVVRDDPDSSWKIIGALLEDHLVVDDGSETESKTPLIWKRRSRITPHTHTIFIRSSLIISTRPRYSPGKKKKPTHFFAFS